PSPVTFSAGIGRWPAGVIAGRRINLGGVSPARAATAQRPRPSAPAAAPVSWQSLTARGTESADGGGGVRDAGGARSPDGGGLGAAHRRCPHREAACALRALPCPVARVRPGFRNSS